MAGTLTGLALARPRPWVRRLVLGLGGVLTLLVPLHWLGPLWSAGPERGAFLLGFYQRFALSLAIPFGLGAVTVALLARRPTRPRALGAGALTVAAYVLGLVASFPVSFNYALLYPLLR